MYCQNLDAIIQPFSYLAMQNISVFIVEIFISEYHNNGRNIQRELRQYLNESHLTGRMYTVQKVWGCTFHWGNNLTQNRLQQYSGACPVNDMKYFKRIKLIDWHYKNCIIDKSTKQRVNNDTTLRYSPKVWRFYLSFSLYLTQFEMVVLKYSFYYICVPI